MNESAVLMLRQIVSPQQSGGSDPEADKITVRVNVEDEPGKKGLVRIRPVDTLSKLFDVFARLAEVDASDRDLIHVSYMTVTGQIIVSRLHV